VYFVHENTLIFNDIYIEHILQKKHTVFLLSVLERMSYSNIFEDRMETDKSIYVVSFFFCKIRKRLESILDQ